MIIIRAYYKLLFISYTAYPSNDYSTDATKISATFHFKIEKAKFK